MNIWKYEWKSNRKTLLFWSIGLFFLVFVGMVKFTGIEATGGANINDLMDQFPKIVLAVFGMTEVDISTLGGYYSILAFYSILCGMVYAIHLGANAVSREMLDKTYEFLFTKPVSRNYILTIKLAVAWFNLFIFSLLNMIFSYFAVETLKLKVDINELIGLYTLVVFLVSSLFLALAFFLSCIVKKAEKGTLYANLILLVVFVLGIIYDMLENGKMIQFFTPLKYFEANDLILHQFNLPYAVLCVVLIVGFIVGGLGYFKKKDLL